jgi:transposase
MESLIAGERDPRVLAGLARGRLTAKHEALVEALTALFEEHHARLLRLLLTTVDHLTAQIAVLDQEIATMLADLPYPRSDTADRPSATTSAAASFGDDLLARLHEIPGVGPDLRAGHPGRSRP